MHRILIDDKPLTFQIDWYVFNRTLGAMDDRTRRELVDSRGTAWHNDPEQGGEANAFETATVAVDQYRGGNIAVFALGSQEGDITPVSVNLGALTDPMTFFSNPDSEYTVSELERAGVIEDTGKHVTYGPYHTHSRLMRLTTIPDGEHVRFETDDYEWED
ncbi:hypothetical protein COO72_12305 [Bifidobacterium callitrichos]|nr:hypothetical protein COO72_12305 [Bifidobacterium callitrichos]